MSEALICDYVRTPPCSPGCPMMPRMNGGAIALAVERVRGERRCETEGADVAPPL